RDAAAIDLVEARLGQRARDLAHAVGAEVEGDDRVAGADARLLADRRGLDELVGLVALVRSADGVDAAVGMVLGAAVHEQVVGLLRAFPALVAVHRPEPADDGADAGAAGVLAPLLDVLEEAGA